MIYHDRVVPPDPPRAWGIGAAGLAACAALGIVLALEWPSYEALDGLVVLPTTAWLVDARLLARATGLRRVAWFLLLLAGLGLVLRWTGGLSDDLSNRARLFLWLASGAAAWLRVEALAWPPDLDGWRARYRSTWPWAVAFCAPTDAFVGGVPCRAALLTGILFVLLAPMILPRPARASFEGIEREVVRARCPRCGVRVDWPRGHPGVCRACGLKRRADSAYPL